MVQPPKSPLPQRLQPPGTGPRTDTEHDQQPLPSSAEEGGGHACARTAIAADAAVHRAFLFKKKKEKGKEEVGRRVIRKEGGREGEVKGRKEKKGRKQKFTRGGKGRGKRKSSLFIPNSGSLLYCQSQILGAFIVVFISMKDGGRQKRAECM